MCGRYELSSNPAVVALVFRLARVPDIRARYNIAPTQQVPIVRIDANGERELVEVRWGLVPAFASDPSTGAPMINARAETVASKAAFRDALASRRCLVPASGFYEWPRAAGRRPVHVGMRDGRPFAFAGLYERWRSPDGESLETCTIVTTPACASLRDVHDRMPAILSDDAHERWLDCANGDVADLLDTWRGEALRVFPVSTRVNSVRNDDQGLCEPVAEDGPAPDAPSGVDLPPARQLSLL